MCIICISLICIKYNIYPILYIIFRHIPRSLKGPIKIYIIYLKTTWQITLSLRLCNGKILLLSKSPQMRRVPEGAQIILNAIFLWIPAKQIKFVNVALLLFNCFALLTICIYFQRMNQNVEYLLFNFYKFSHFIHNCDAVNKPNTDQTVS